MELVILLIGVVAVLGFFIWRDRKFDESGSHPLDGATKSAEVPYKVEPPVLTTKVDGIGHESVAITEEAPVKKTKKSAKPKGSGTAQPKKAGTKPSTKPAKITKSTAKPSKPKKAPKK